MEINKKIFDMVQEYKWNEIMNNIKNTDINIRNTNGLYLIYYFILFNQYNYIQTILSQEPVIDYTDSEGKTILYIPIKFYYNNIVDKLLEYNKNNIGVNIIDIQDNDHNTPLHYSITFNNIYAFEKLLEYNANLLIKNKQGNTILHTAIHNKNSVAIFQKIFQTKFYIENNNIINLQNSFGETPLHIACNLESIEMIKLILDNKANPNIYDQTHLTPIFYAITLSNSEIVELLLKYNTDINLQDINGNVPIIYAFQEKNEKIYNLLLEKFNNYNAINLNGRTVLHNLLYDIMNEKSLLNKFPIDKLIENTDLNYQDNNGNSCLHLLFMGDLWENYKNILETKKLNAFILNKYNETPFSFIKNKDLVIDLLTKSYLFILRKNKKNWLNQIDKECVKPKLKNNKDLCYDDIKNIILTQNISIPVKENKFTFIKDQTTNKIISTYTGIILDIFIGVIHLQQKYSDNINSSITLNFFENDLIKKHYSVIGYEDKFDFYNFEILWSYQQLLFPSNLKLSLQNNKKRFFIVPLGIELSIGAHSNMIIIDYHNKEIERFEPIGSDYPFGFNYNPKELDNQLTYFFKENLPDFKYVKPSDYLPKIGFQSFETSEHLKQKKIGDPSGFCAGWSNWWVDMRLTYQNIPREKLVSKLIKKIKSMNIPFKTIVREHTNTITKLRDEILESVELYIDNWLNDNYNEQQIKNLIKRLESIIMKL
jgi:ankyrin repeat protein